MKTKSYFSTKTNIRILRIAFHNKLIQTNNFIHTHTHTHTYIYIYMRGAYDKFPAFFRMDILSWRRLLKIQDVIAMHLMRWLTNFYDFRFKWAAATVIGIQPTKAWLSQRVNFKNPIWTWRHFRRTICNKIQYKTWK